MVVTGSGSITAYDLLQTATGSAINSVKQRFNQMVTYSSSTPTSAQLDRTEKDVLMFVWDARDLDAGEYMAFDFVPCFITSLGHGSAYGSGQTAPVNFSTADTDEKGHRRSYQLIPYQSEIGTQIAAWDAA